jgi:hypothetical protein
MNGMGQLDGLRMLVNTTNVGNSVYVSYAVLKVYYYPQYLALYNYPEFNFVEKFIVIFGEYMLITFVRWSILGLGLLFLALSIIFLWLGFKYRKGVMLISALIVFLLGIVLAIVGAGI